jgi:hypothetical protein
MKLYVAILVTFLSVPVVAADSDDAFSGTYRFPNSKLNERMTVIPSADNAWNIEVSGDGSPPKMVLADNGTPQRFVIVPSDQIQKTFVAPTPLGSMSCLALEYSSTRLIPYFCRLPKGAMFAFSEENGRTRLAKTGYFAFFGTVAGIIVDSVVRDGLHGKSEDAADLQPPSVPKHLTATPRSGNRIQLEWSASIDNLVVAKYMVYRNGLLTASLNRHSANVYDYDHKPTYMDTGLPEKATYSYRVSACDQANNCSEQSELVSVNTSVTILPTTTVFIDNQDGTVTHSATGLTWMRCAMGMAWNGTTCSGSASKYTWDQAKVLGTAYADKNDWRLPSIVELNSIVERQTFSPAISELAFPNTPSSRFWSGSLKAHNSNFGIVVDFSKGELDGFSRTSSQAIRLVRGLPFDATAPYTPTSDFADNGDGTATHLLTGLMWKRCVEGMLWNGSTCLGREKAFDWADAIDQSSSFAGYSDWRAPTVEELLSIVEFQSDSPTVNRAIFPGTQSSAFWSRSSVAGNSNSAWDVHFHFGSAKPTPKYSGAHLRLVRGNMQAWYRK